MATFLLPRPRTAKSLQSHVLTGRQCTAWSCGPAMHGAERGHGCRKQDPAGWVRFQKRRWRAAAKRRKKRQKTSHAGDSDARELPARGSLHCHA